MEDNKEYASKGVAGSALGIGIGALALELLRGGALGNILGGNCSNGCNHGHGHGEVERRLACLEAATAATAVATVKNEELDRQRSHYEGIITRLEIKNADCYNIKGKPMMCPEQMADPYHGGDNYLVTRHVNGYPRGYDGRDGRDGHNGCCNGRRYY